MTRPTMPLLISRRRFRMLLQELHRRGEDRRESGAFLLAHRGAQPGANGSLEITEIIYYDDLDADCLTGGITMHAAGLSRLNEFCRERQLRVVGDVHTHPHTHVHQSLIDATHPMVALPGHIAYIVPNYAAGRIAPADLGAHQLRRGGTWEAVYGNEVNRMLQVRPGFLLAFTRLSRRLPTSKETR